MNYALSTIWYSIAMKPPAPKLVIIKKMRRTSVLPTTKLNPTRWVGRLPIPA